MKFSDDEIKIAINYVRQDVKDDFWPDILNYEDYFISNYVESINFENYTPKCIFSMDIPKVSLILRPGQFIEFSDRLYWQLIINKFAKDVDKKLVSQDISFGYRTSEDKKYFIANNIENWKKFNLKEKEYYENNNGDGFLLKTDISAYFEHIKIKDVLRILRSLGVNGSILNSLSIFLFCWGEIGLPQQNNCSSFLANVYLNEVDEAMIADEYKYFRFVDDIKIFCLDKCEMRNAIKKLTELLRPLNLHLNSAKTGITDFRENFINNHNPVPDNMVLEYAMASDIEKYFDIIESELQKIWKEAISEDELNKTKFNYCINRFKEISSEFPINDLLENELYDPAFSREVCKFLALFVDRVDVQTKLVEVFNTSSYEFQKIFILQALLGASHLNMDLNSIDKNEILKSNNFMLIGYYFILVFKFGNDGQKANIRNLFFNKYIDNHKIARYFLIALSFSTNKKEAMNDLVRKIPSLEFTRIYLLSSNYSF